jgi:hypothetical protein
MWAENTTWFPCGDQPPSGRRAGIELRVTPLTDALILPAPDAPESRALSEAGTAGDGDRGLALEHLDPHVFERARYKHPLPCFALRQPRLCPVCGAGLDARRGIYCSARCKKRAYRARRAARTGKTKKRS